MLLQQKQVEQILALPTTALPRFQQVGAQLPQNPIPSEPAGDIPQAYTRPGSLADKIRRILNNEAEAGTPGLPGSVSFEEFLKRFVGQGFVGPFKVVNWSIGGNLSTSGQDTSPQPSVAPANLPNQFGPADPSRVARFTDEGLARIVAQILTRKAITQLPYTLKEQVFLTDLLAALGERSDAGRGLETNADRRVRLTNNALQVLIAFQNGYLGAAGGGAMLRGDKADP